MAPRKQIYKITYPNGKIYVGKDLTGENKGVRTLKQPFKGPDTNGTAVLFQHFRRVGRSRGRAP